MKQGRKEKQHKMINLDLNGTRGKGKTAQNDPTVLQSNTNWSPNHKNSFKGLDMK